MNMTMKNKYFNSPVVPVLSHGKHNTRNSKKSCIMEMVSVVDNSPWTDYPPCTLYAITEIAQAVNDWLLADDRYRIWPEFPRLFDTAELDKNPEFINAFCKYVTNETMKQSPHDYYHEVGQVIDDLSIKDYTAANDTALGIILSILGDYGIAKNFGEMVRILSDVLDLADDVLGRTEYRMIDVEPLIKEFGASNARI